MLKHGKDSRFDEIKENTGQFSVAWYVPLLLLAPLHRPRSSHIALLYQMGFTSEESLTSRFGQATWITLVSLPAILVNTIPRAAHPALGLRDLIGVGIWAGGLGLEILADSRMSPFSPLSFFFLLFSKLPEA